MKEKHKKTNAARILDDLGIAYELVSYEVSEDDLSAVTAAEAAGLDSREVYKTIVTRTDKREIIEACIPAGDEIDMKALASAADCKSAEPVRVSELPALTGYVRGGCSPLGGKKRYPVYIQRDVLDLERFCINAGERGLMFKMAPADLVRASGAVPADIVRKRA